MKLCIILTVCFTLSVSAKSLAQQEKINLDLDNVSVKQLFDAIQKQTDLYFVFNTEQTKNLGNFSVKSNNESVSDVLERIFSKSGLTFDFEGNLIIVRPDQQQNLEKITVNGTVKDEQGNPLPGVTIRVKNTTIGFASNVNGEFNFEIPAGYEHILVLSFVGFETQEVKVVNSDPLTIVMKEDIKDIGEVVVTGIFNRDARTYTGAVTTITQEQIRANYSRNLIQTLSNLDPSFRIIVDNAQGNNPNRLPEIQLRGATTLVDYDDLQLSTLRAEANTPLFILDGFEVDLQRVVDMNDYEIESITILKDANATSLYGSRGANGVIVITSTFGKGTAGIEVTYTGRLDMEIPDLSSYNLMNAKEKLEFEHLLGHWDYYDEAYEELKRNVDEGVNTNWKKIPIRTGVGQNHVIGINGGNEQWRIGLDLNYKTIRGAIKDSDHDTFNGSVRLQYTHGELLLSNILMIGMNWDSESPYMGQGKTFADYVYMNPYWDPYEEDGKAAYNYFHPLLQNPLDNPMYYSTINWWNKTKGHTISNTINLSYRFDFGLRVRGSFGFSLGTSQNNTFNPPSSKDFADKEPAHKGSYYRNQRERDKWNSTFNLDYTRIFNDVHNITAGFNYDIQENNEKYTTLRVEGFANDYMDDLSNAMSYPIDHSPNGSEDKSRRIGILGNGNYSYDMRYHIDLTYRTDGASNFGKYSRWAPFYSVGLGWTASNEWFIKEKLHFINLLRFRYSYGVSGSVNFSPAQAMTVYIVELEKYYLNGIVTTVNTFGNPDLKWQNTYQHNFGANLAILNSRLSIDFNYYNKKTDNNIAEIALTPEHGYNSYTENIGEMKNTGWELAFTGIIIKQENINWTVSPRFAHNKNVVSKLSELLKEKINATGVDSARDLYRYKEGYSTTSLWGYRSAGVNPADGYRMYYTDKNEPSYTTSNENIEDFVFLGDQTDKVNGSINSNFRYKNFTLNLGFSFRWGAKKTNFTLLSKVENMQAHQNLDKRILKDKWRNPGDITKYKSIYNSVTTTICDEFVQRDNELACTNINLSYMFPEKWLRHVGVKTLILRTEFSDVFRISSIKRERGTAYPFTRNPNLSITCTF